MRLRIHSFNHLNKIANYPRGAGIVGYDIVYSASVLNGFKHTCVCSDCLKIEPELEEELLYCFEYGEVYTYSDDFTGHEFMTDAIKNP